MTCLAISRCKKTSHVILRFEESNKNAGGGLELLASIWVKGEFPSAQRSESPGSFTGLAKQKFSA